jgi:hypothetical protein
MEKKNSTLRKVNVEIVDVQDDIEKNLVLVSVKITHKRRSWLKAFRLIPNEVIQFEDFEEQLKRVIETDLKWSEKISQVTTKKGAKLTYQL